MEFIIFQQNIMLVFIMLAMASITSIQAGIRVGFYSNACSQAEFIVRSTVERHFQADPTIAPGLLRMHFHDCFSQGCDASVLIDGPDSERTAPPNHSLRGFQVIDDAKSQLEDACPGVVSCADILALVARDSVALTNGPYWEVPTGRRDSRVSNASDAMNLPGPTDSVAVQKLKFAAMGLNTQDLVILVGGHTIGTTACRFFSHRLSNFTTSQNNGHDTKINPAFLQELQELCLQDGEATRRVGLDFGSESIFDTSFFLNLRNGRGVLESDQMLWTDDTTRVFVRRILQFRGMFNREFARAMVKMSSIGVKTGREGEIRRVCSAVN